jgi:hypothetical protein
MTTKKILLSGLVALGLAAVGVHGQTIAAVPFGNNADDLMLGFYNTASPVDLVFDLGSASLFTGLTGTTPYTVLGFNNADLTDATVPTGSGDGTNDGAALSLGYSANTHWSVAAGNNSQTGGMWVTAPVGTPLFSTANQTGPSNSIKTVTAELNSYQGFTNENSPAAVLLESKDYSNDVAPLVGSQSTLATSPATSTSLVLWQLAGTATGSAPGVELGTFTLTQSTGLLTFTPFEAIPEPSTYAAILGALTIGFVLIRRRSQTGAMNALV